MELFLAEGFVSGGSSVVPVVVEGVAGVAVSPVETVV
jgi:hypothetical protein